MQKEHLYEFGLQWLSRRHVMIFISILGKFKAHPLRYKRCLPTLLNNCVKTNQTKGKKNQNGSHKAWSSKVLHPSNN
jgi:hypothetical protein